MLLEKLSRKIESEIESLRGTASGHLSERGAERVREGQLKDVRTHPFFDPEGVLDLSRRVARGIPIR